MNKNRTAPQPPQRTRPLLECGWCGRLAPVTAVGIVCRCDVRVRAALAARKEGAA